jgi:hypothetical protein
VVSFAIHVGKLDLAGPMIEMMVGVGGRVYEVHSKDLGFKFGDIEDHGNTLMLF